MSFVDGSFQCRCTFSTSPDWNSEDVRDAMYAFIKSNKDQFGIRLVCRMLGVAPSGYYACLQQPLSDRAQEGLRLLRVPPRGRHSRRSCSYFTSRRGHKRS